MSTEENGDQFQPNRDNISEALIRAALTRKRRAAQQAKTLKEERAKKSVEAMKYQQDKEENNIWRPDGTLDARAFKKIIFERQAGSMTGPKNFLAAAVDSANQSEFLEDNILLHGLKSFGITIDELLEANLDNLDENAYKPIEPRFKDQEEFVASVQTHLQSPVVRSLRSIVGIVKPKRFGIDRAGIRARSLPNRQPKDAISRTTPQSPTALQGQSSQDRFPGSGMSHETGTESQPHALETVSEEQNDQNILMQSRTPYDMEKGGLGAEGEQVMSGLQSVPELEQESDGKRSRKGLHTKNFSVPGLQVGVSPLTPLKGESGLKGPHVESSKHPMMSQLALHNRSSTMKDEHSLHQQILGLQEELDSKIESDRYNNKTPFRSNQQIQSNIQIQPHSSQMIIIPPPPKDLDPNVLIEDYYDVYQNMVRKYQRRDRRGKPLSMDPEELNALDERGYKMKAERYARKRDTKKVERKRKSAFTGGKAAVRGDADYSSSTSSSATSHSSASYGGVPEADVEYLKSQDKQDKINARRNERRAGKWQVIFDAVVSEGVKREISAAILSRQATYERSDGASVQPPSEASKPVSEGAETSASPRTQVKRFAEAQRQMKGLMDTMATRLKSHFLEDIDEEVPEEYLVQKEKESIQNFTRTSFSGISSSTSQKVDPLEQIEASIATMMDGLVHDIRESNMENARENGNHSEPKVQTKPSQIIDQAQYIGARRELSQRMSKFQRTQNTSPRFYDNQAEKNHWTVKLQSLDTDKVSQIFSDKRVESIHRLAQHLRSKNLVPQEAVAGIPKGFNQKMPLDQVMLELGSAIHRRTEEAKEKQFKRMGSLGQSPGATARHTISPNPQSQMLQQSVNEQNYQSLNQVSSVFETGQSPSAASYGFAGYPGYPQQIHQKRNSDQLMQDVNAVFRFLAQNNQNSHSMNSLGQTQVNDLQSELQDCIIVDKPSMNRQHSKTKTGSQASIGAQNTSAICYCNHMAPHRHFYMSPSHSTRNFLGSDLPNSQLLASSGEQINDVALQTQAIATNTTSSANVIELHLSLAPEQFQDPRIGQGQIAMDPPASSSGGAISPLGFAKPPPMTDRHWNNSELKKFSVSQSKSNADIIEELRRFKLEGDAELAEAAIAAAAGAETANASELDPVEESQPMDQHALVSAGRKGKTFTVLFKKEKKNKDQESNPHLRSNPHMQMETPGLHRDPSQEEYLKPGMVERGRYGDKIESPTNENDKKPSKAPPRKVHQISVLQNLSSSDAKQGAYSYNYKLSARQQPLSVSVKNIELPSQYRVSKQQKPTNAVIHEVLPSNQKPDSKPQKLQEVGLQTTFDNSGRSFRPAGAQQQTVIVPSSQLDQYPEIIASQPTIGTESVEKLHVQGQLPVARYGDSAGEKREGTRLLPMSEDASQDGTPLKKKEQSPGHSPQNKTPTPLDLGKGTPAMGEVSGGKKPTTKNVATDAFNVKGVASSLQQRAPSQTQASPKFPNQKHEVDVKTDDVTATVGAISQFEVPAPIYQQNQQEASDGGAYETDGGTAYGSNKGLGVDSNAAIGGMTRAGVTAATNMLLSKSLRGANADLAAVDATDTIVRNFKPSKTKKLPELQRNLEQKLSQLADSNVTPLGLFNQDLHAQREWNKLMAQKNFSATLNDKQMTFKDAMLHEMLMPVSPPTDANRTTNQLPGQQERARDDETFTADPSVGSRSRLLPSKDPGDNSTLMSPDSRTGVYKKLYEPAIQVLNESGLSKNNKGPKARKQQQLNLQAKVPQARHNSKVIVFNFKGNQDLPDELLKRMELEQANQAQQASHYKNVNSTSKPLLLANSSNRALGPGGAGIFSPKRNSVNPNGDSVSIYAQAKAALESQPASSQNLLREAALKGSSTQDLVLKEERNRYRTTIRKRSGSQRPGQDPASKQPTSLSTAKFLIGRRNPTTNAAMFSQKVSPFKPMGGGFKQNLNIEVSPERMEQEVAAQREKLGNHQQPSGPARKSRHVSNNTLDFGHTEQRYEDQIGFRIERANLNLKAITPKDIQDAQQEEVEALSSKTKEKIRASALSQLNQQLLDLEVGEEASSQGARNSLAGTPNPPDLDEQDDDGVAKLRASKSSTGPRIPPPSATVQNFEVPKMALMPKPLKEAVETNESFAKIVNEPGPKHKAANKSNLAKKTFQAKKTSNVVPYPMKSGVIGETLQASSFNVSNNFQQDRSPKDNTSNAGGNSPRLEGTRMKLSFKSKNDTRSSPFEKDPDSPRKRLSPKTLATIKGGTKENPIKMESTASKLRGTKRHREPGERSDSRMRTESRGLSQNVSASRPDLLAKNDSEVKEPPALVGREYSAEDILNSANSKKHRQVVGLNSKNGEPNSSLQIVASRDELERAALSAKQPSNLHMYKLDELHSKIQHLDNDVEAQELGNDALQDNPAELTTRYAAFRDAERQIAALVSQRAHLDGQFKHPFIASVAGQQVGAANYRKKSKKNKGDWNFEFQNDRGGKDPLNRILGSVKGRNGPVGAQTANAGPPQRQLASEINSGVGVIDSRGSDILLNFSHQRDLQLSVNNRNRKY